MHMSFFHQWQASFAVAAENCTLTVSQLRASHMHRFGNVILFSRRVRKNTDHPKPLPQHAQFYVSAELLNGRLVGLYMARRLHREKSFEKETATFNGRTSSQLPPPSHFFLFFSLCANPAGTEFHERQSPIATLRPVFSQSSS
jgi:hypothetical protein